MPPCRLSPRCLLRNKDLLKSAFDLVAEAPEVAEVVTKLRTAFI